MVSTITIPKAASEPVFVTSQQVGGRFFLERTLIMCLPTALEFARELFRDTAEILTLPRRWCRNCPHEPHPWTPAGQSTGLPWAARTGAMPGEERLT